MKLLPESLIEKATIKDAEKILDLQKLAYRSEAVLHNDFTIQPLRQTLSELLVEFTTHLVLKIESDTGIIGSTRCYLEHDTCHICKLIVHPDYQNQGIGGRLLGAAENQFPNAKRFELFTAEKSKRNVYFYEKNGYRIFRKEVLDANITFVFMEKIEKEDCNTR